MGLPDFSPLISWSWVFTVWIYLVDIYILSRALDIFLKLSQGIDSFSVTTASQQLHHQELFYGFYIDFIFSIFHFFYFTTICFFFLLSLLFFFFINDRIFFFFLFWIVSFFGGYYFYQLDVFSGKISTGDGDTKVTGWKNFFIYSRGQV